MAYQRTIDNQCENATLLPRWITSKNIKILSLDLNYHFFSEKGEFGDCFDQAWPFWWIHPSFIKVSLRCMPSIVKSSTSRKEETTTKIQFMFTRFTTKTSENKTIETNMPLWYICWIFDKQKGTFWARQPKINLFSQHWIQYRSPDK